MTTDIEFGCQVTSYGDVPGTVAGALRAEAAGFDLVTLPDHLFHPTGSEEFLTEPPWEVFAMLGAIAERTERVDLMPGVTDSVRRHPTELAHVVATLDRLTGGRAGLGIGAGEAFNLAPVKDFEWDRPFTRFRETLEVIRGLWASTPDDPLSFEGEYFELDRAHMGLKPARERPPVWIGGYGPRMRTLTGRVADGWFPWIYTPDEYAADLRRVLSAAGEAGRDPEDVERAVMLPTAVGEDGDEVRRETLARSRVNLALRPPLLADLGYEDLAEEAPYMWQMAFDERQRERLRRVAGEIPEAEVEKMAVVGTPEEAIERIERFADAGVNRLVTFVAGDFEETMRHYEREIIPYFRE